MVCEYTYSKGGEAEGMGTDVGRRADTEVGASDGIPRSSFTFRL